MKQNRPGKIRVVHIITRLILGGAQENTLLTVEGLQARDEYEVSLISGPALGPEGSLIQRARNNRINLTIIPEMRRNIHPLKDVITFIKLYRLLRKSKPDVVHTHSSKAGFLGRLAAALAGVPVIVHTIHGLPFHPYQSRLINLFYILTERIASIFTHQIISVAEAMTDQALRVGVGERGRYETVYSALALDEYKDLPDADIVRRELGIKKDEKVIGTIARLFPLKGHDFLLKIAPAIIKNIPQARFLFVGDGILRDQLESEAARLGIIDHITFAGLVKPERIPSLINIMDVLVHPSLREGLARAVPQALALAKPVVVFDLDGAREVVRNRETGWLIPPGDQDRMIEAIVASLKNQNGLVREMGERGRNLVYQRFAVPTMVEKIHSLYQKFLAF
ncbi:MAG: glycosyltransferase family 4 protein [Planctomycetes bacterium]|nr:glycosyltransferase family 4 protein [Planctomycetota bacterium]